MRHELFDKHETTHLGNVGLIDQFETKVIHTNGTNVLEAFSKPTLAQRVSEKHHQTGRKRQLRFPSLALWAGQSTLTQF